MMADAFFGYDISVVEIAYTRERNSNLLVLLV